MSRLRTFAPKPRSEATCPGQLLYSCLGQPSGMVGLRKARRFVTTLQTLYIMISWSRIARSANYRPPRLKCYAPGSLPLDRDVIEWEKGAPESSGDRPAMETAALTVRAVD